MFAWRRGGLYVAAKGGHNGESHNHNDIGNFIVYADGEPEIIDVGNCVYTAKTFGAERYELMNTRSKNHNVPLIGGRFAGVSTRRKTYGRMKTACAWISRRHIPNM